MHSKFKSLFIIFALIVFLLEASFSAGNVRRDLTFAFFNLKLSTVGIKKAFGTLWSNLYSSQRRDCDHSSRFLSIGFGRSMVQVNRDSLTLMLWCVTGHFKVSLLAITVAIMNLLETELVYGLFPGFSITLLQKWVNSQCDTIVPDIHDFDCSHAEQMTHPKCGKASWQCLDPCLIFLTFCLVCFLCFHGFFCMLLSPHMPFSKFIYVLRRVVSTVDDASGAA